MEDSDGLNEFVAISLWQKEHIERMCCMLVVVFSLGQPTTPGKNREKMVGRKGLQNCWGDWGIKTVVSCLDSVVLVLPPC